MEANGKEAPKEPVNTWTLAHPKFVMGKPMMTMEELASAGVNTRGLNKHYIFDAIHKENPSIVGEFKARDLHSGPGYFSVAWSDLYDLFNLDALDISLIRCLAL
ncbi:hypothetical protein C2845_PM13G09110 [Panicum miliaceum]|uniref:Uncharacterized protein n=1 Tax=Panicum miliaceum TaxID=4540 RepID=A0A3L6RGH2_PANMI|nr:hypothetical protein C2845_PM13G09110 [Panicum miliaceum]